MVRGLVDFIFKRNSGEHIVGIFLPWGLYECLVVPRLLPVSILNTKTSV